ncbi:GNAT family N-acetyltransferase [Nisaea acidiphila]|uniref:GNAT family N-acetyltransferase n=1 Tax=Nisaea acidiphila TaxID=1862145 RepID=A0A9J7AP71_9PROT|nr:GNAT family N-acetyltransferase [Nisaea acidiphila]UUX48714.1 GNAT family N-acetyltransferase [Nisaea acidiphila]
MNGEFVVRPAEEADSNDISDVIAATVRESNAMDYSRETIETVVASSGPVRMRELILEGAFFVAEQGGRIVGVAGLVDDTVRRLFVLPEFQGSGIGRDLLTALENAAVHRGVRVLRVNSSLTAVRFYRKLGFADGGEECLNGTRFVRMSKALAGE